MGEHSRFEKKSVMILTAIACCIAWGSAFPSIKLSYDMLNITGMFEMILFAGLRFAFAGAGVLVFTRLKTKRSIRLTRKELPFTLLISLLQTFGGYILFYIGIASVSAVKSSILVSTSVFTVAVLAHFMFKEDKLSWRKAIGLLLGFAGVVLVNVSLLDGALFSFSMMGEGLILISVTMGAITVVLIRMRRRSIDVMKLNGWQLFLGGMGMILVGMIGDPHIPRFTWASGALLLWLAALSGIAFTLWFTMLKYHNAAPLEQYKFLIPVSGTLLSVLILGESLRIEMLFAVLLVSIGTVIVNMQRRNAIEKS